MTQSDVVLSRAEVKKMVKDRLRLVSPDEEVAMAKLTLLASFEELELMRRSQAEFEENNPWLRGIGSPPENVEGDDGGASLIFAAYKLLCDRIDKRQASQPKSAKELQETFLKHEEYKAKAGQMIPVNTAFAVLLKVGGSAQRYIPDSRKADFIAEFADIQADFIKDNPMLKLAGS